MINLTTFVLTGGQAIAPLWLPITRVPTLTELTGTLTELRCPRRMTCPLLSHRDSPTVDWQLQLRRPIALFGYWNASSSSLAGDA